MSNPWAMFQTNAVAEQKGIRIDYGAFYFTVARAGGSNDKFKAKVRELMRPYERAIELGEMDDKVASKLAAEAFAETVVLGWGSVVDGKDVEGVLTKPNGDKVEFSVDAVKDLFAELPELFTDLMQQANKPQNFRRVAQEVDAKN